MAALAGASSAAAAAATLLPSPPCVIVALLARCIASGLTRGQSSLQLRAKLAEQSPTMGLQGSSCDATANKHGHGDATR